MSYGKRRSMKERISYHNGKSKIGGTKGAYSKGFVKGAYAAKKELLDYYGNKIRRMMNDSGKKRK